MRPKVFTLHFNFFPIVRRLKLSGTDPYINDYTIFKGFIKDLDFYLLTKLPAKSRDDYEKYKSGSS
jgi:hypothetical protein